MMPYCSCVASATASRPLAATSTVQPNFWLTVLSSASSTRLRRRASLQPAQIARAARAALHLRSAPDPPPTTLTMASSSNDGRTSGLVSTEANPMPRYFAASPRCTAELNRISCVVIELVRCRPIVAAISTSIASIARRTCGCGPALATSVKLLDTRLSGHSPMPSQATSIRTVQTHPERLHQPDSSPRQSCPRHRHNLADKSRAPENHHVKPDTLR